MQRLFLLLAMIAGAPAADSHPPSLVGTYDGHQMEMGAGLELTGDGRFQYGLAYGALDETATGTWSANADHVLLTSDPVTAPRFALVDQKPATPATLHLTLDAPQGMSRQFFDAVIETARGQTIGKQFSEEGTVTVPINDSDPPVRVRLFLPMFDLRGDQVTIAPERGYGLHFRFDANDLGKVDFQATPLQIDHGDLLLARYDRMIRFHRVAGP